jgi:hypothetical protein
MEVYTGWLRLNGYHPTDQLDQETFVSFLCPGKNLVQPYKGNLIDFTLTAAPSSVATDEDEANIFAVDSATLELVTQKFPGVAGTLRCLQLKAHLGALNTRIDAITYQATVLSSAAPDHQLREIPVDENTVPNIE